MVARFKLPGSDEIIDLLLSIPTETFILGIEYSIEQAIKSKDEEWLSNLKYIFEKKSLDNKDIKQHELYNKLIDFEF